jgi:hypothetical protein
MIVQTPRWTDQTPVVETYEAEISHRVSKNEIVNVPGAPVTMITGNLRKHLRNRPPKQVAEPQGSKSSILGSWC